MKSSCCDCAAPCWLTYISAVLRLGEVDEVVVVHVLSVEQVAVLPLAQILRVDAVGPEELLVGHAERLTDGLSNQLGLADGKRRRTTGTITVLVEVCSARLIWWHIFICHYF